MQTDPHEEWHLVGPTETGDPHQVIKQWEKLRLIYNAVLIPWTVLLIAAKPGETALLWEDVILGGLTANVCFCLGPVVETYLVWIGANPRSARGWLFAFGTAFTALAVLLAIM